MTTTNNGRASFFLLRCKTLRIGAGLTMNELARKSEVDRATISKIEAHHGVTEPVIAKVFNALNQKHANKLNYDKEVSPQPTAGRAS